jgi:hypothetical protein
MNIFSKIYNYFNSNSSNSKSKSNYKYTNLYATENDFLDTYQKLLLKQTALNEYLTELEKKLEKTIQYKEDMLVEYQETYLEYLCLIDEITLYRKKINI